MSILEITITFDENLIGRRHWRQVIDIKIK